MEINITSDDLKMIRKFQDILSRGYYCDGKQVTDLHNKVLGTRLNSTNCGACIRTRIQALVEAADKFERLSQRLSEASKQEEPTTTKVEENKAVKKENKKVKK